MGKKPTGNYDLPLSVFLFVLQRDYKTFEDITLIIKVSYLNISPDAQLIK